MPHVRTQIRDAAKLRLTGLPSTAGRVYVGRSRVLGDSHGDTLLIYTRDDRRWSEGDSAGDVPVIGRVCRLMIEARVVTTGATAAEDAEDGLDQIEAEVIPALGDLGGLAISIDWQSSDINVDSDGKSHLGSNVMEFAVYYRTPENDQAAFV